MLSIDPIWCNCVTVKSSIWIAYLDGPREKRHHEHGQERDSPLEDLEDQEGRGDLFHLADLCPPLILSIKEK